MPPTRRTVRAVRWALWPVVAVLTLAVVGQASYATFSARVSNTGNNLAVGTVNLTDNDAGAALLSLTNLKPGSSGSRCIVVTSDGSLASSVKLYATDVASTKSLGSYITLTLTQGTGGSFGACTGFNPLGSGSAVYSGTLAAFTTAATSYSTGVGSWTPSGSAAEARTFQFGYAVNAAIPDSAQGGTVSFGATWEAQNT